MQAVTLKDLKEQGLLVSAEVPTKIKDEIEKLKPFNKKQPANLEKTQLSYLATEIMLYNDDLLQFVAQLSEGIVINDGKILTKDWTIIEDTQTSPQNDQLKLRELDEEFLHYDGKLAVISSPGWENWYHWLLQVLPRLAVLNESGVEYDHVYINGLEHEWQKTSLKSFLRHFDIPEEKLLLLNEDCIIKAKELIVPSVPHIPSKHHNYLSPWLKETLKDVFLKSDTECETYDKIYISREKTSCRKVINEEKIKGRLEDLDFKILNLEGLLPEVQAKIFANAKVIAGPHGSGFANLIFTDPEFKLMEIDYEEARSYYKAMTEQLGGQYKLYHVQAENTIQNLNRELDPNMKIAPNDFSVELLAFIPDLA